MFYIKIYQAILLHQIEGREVAKMSSFHESSLFPPVSLSLSTASVECMYIYRRGGGRTSDVMGKNAEVCRMSIYASMSPIKF